MIDFGDIDRVIVLLTTDVQFNQTQRNHLIDIMMKDNDERQPVRDSSVYLAIESPWHSRFSISL